MAGRFLPLSLGEPTAVAKIEVDGMRDVRWGVAGPREASGVAGLGFSTFGKV